jgi:hypothetical protein
MEVVEGDVVDALIHEQWVRNLTVKRTPDPVNNISWCFVGMDGTVHIICNQEEITMTNIRNRICS